MPHWQLGFCPWNLSDVMTSENGTEFHGRGHVHVFLTITITTKILKIREHSNTTVCKIVNYGEHEGAYFKTARRVRYGMISSLYYCVYGWSNSLH